MLGVPVRLAIGARDLENGTVEVARRDTKEKQTTSLEGVADFIENLLADIQQNMYNKALSFRDANIRKAATWEEFLTAYRATRLYLCAHGMALRNRRKN
jgi:prolyl-tRNA synthetase